MASERLPPAQPAYILRGHSCQVHALHFFGMNTRLLTADAQGWVVSWSLASKRPVAVWKAHENTILGLASWENDRIITYVVCLDVDNGLADALLSRHGRDSKLIIWQLKSSDEKEMDKVLPIDDSNQKRKQPWILHMMTVNTLNFCSFAVCNGEWAGSSAKASKIEHYSVTHASILVAVPNTLDSEGIDIFQLPSESRVSTVGASKTFKTGMAMALAICTVSNTLYLAAGYESGHTSLYRQVSPSDPWQILYFSQPHSQPILSLSFPCSPSAISYYLTTSADALIVKNPLAPSTSLASASLSQNEPLKVQQTKHAGQQGLSIRSDGKIFATAGWDARVRVYSAKTLREVAVLKWHKEGCYCTAFATIMGNEETEGKGNEVEKQDLVADGASDPLSRTGNENALIIREVGGLTLSAVQQRRDHNAQSTHWLAAGSKDGKVSLWDIY